MRNTRLAVFEPLSLLSVTRYGKALRLLVRDEEGSLHRIRFRFANRDAARRHVPQLTAWIIAGTPLAYVRGAEESALVDVDALLARAA